jgi:GLPGLI family protein
MTFAGFAQLTQGKINYDMTFSSDNPDMAMAIGMMQGSKMSLAFMPGKSRSDVSMGTMGTMVTIADDKSKKALMLMDMMGMKYAMEMDLGKAEKEAEADTPDYKVEITKETKDILGYKCTKAIMTPQEADAEGGTITMWFTKDINATTTGQNYYNQDMPGFPMSFSIAQGEMLIDMTVTEIDKKVDKNVFKMTIPEGYEVKTEEEMMMMGQ